MIVDDSVFMRNVLGTMLAMKGYTVVAEADDGAEAVEQYLALRPRIVFMDVLMPRKTGKDAAREILSVDSDAKVVMCSSLGHDELVKAALESGVSEVLFKPYRDSHLDEVLQRICRC